jgi:hypothetical protein
MLSITSKTLESYYKTFTMILSTFVETLKHNTMKKIISKLFLLFSFIVLTTSFAFGQKSSIEILYSDSAELIINQKSISGETTVEELVKMMGKANEVKEHPNEEKSYFYSELGIVFFTRNGLVKGLGVNFNWDGDKKFPKQTYTGSLKLGDTDINKKSKNEAIAGIKTIQFICPFPSMCASKNRQAKVRCTAAFKDEQLTQVVFLIK